MGSEGVSEYKLLIELRGVYDGWSVGVKHDDTLVNRWNKEDNPKRWQMTQDYIEARELMQSKENANG